MSYVKADINIGRRCYMEALRLYGDAKFIPKRLRVSNSLPYTWMGGATPSTRVLAKMAWHGADINYILTGRRADNGKAD